MNVQNFFKIMKRMRWAISQLTPREQKMIKFRWGFYMFKKRGKTLEETGKKFGVTRERIRQIEAKAILKINNELKNNNK